MIAMLLNRNIVRLKFAGALLFASCVMMARPGSATPPVSRARELDRLIDAIASHNEAPKLLEESGAAYPVFSDNFDWKEQKRVREAAWALSQDDSNDLWGRLMEHCVDKRYSATCHPEDFSPHNWNVGSVCRKIARDKLICAYLRHLKPGKTAPFGGDLGYGAPDDTTDFVPGSVQADLRFPPHLYEPDDFVAWYRARKDKPLYELQIEMCKWAVKVVEDAPNVAEEPKKEYVAAVKQEIESLKKNKRPVVDHSSWASPMSCKAMSFYDSRESGQRERDLLLGRMSKKTGHH